MPDLSGRVIALLANPDSGSGEADDVERGLRARGLDVARFELDHADDVVAAAPERVIVAGGDGSIGSRRRGRRARRASRSAWSRSGPPTTSPERSELPDDPDEALELAATGERTAAASTSAGSATAAVRQRRQHRALAGRRAQGARAEGPARAALLHRRRAARRPVRATGARPASRSTARPAFDGRRLAGDRRRSPGPSAAAPRSTPTPPTAGSTLVAIEARSRARLALHGYGLRAGHGSRSRRASSPRPGRGSRSRPTPTAGLQRRRRAGRRRAGSSSPPSRARSRSWWADEASTRDSWTVRAAARRASRARAGGGRRAATGRWESPAPGRSAGTRPTASATAARAPSATRSRPRSTSARRTSCAPPRRSPGAPISTGNDAELLDQRRPDLPRVPRDRPVGRADAQRPDLRLLARRDRRRGRRGDPREGARGRPLQGDPRRARRGADGAPPDPRDARRRRRGAPLPPAEAVRDQAGREPHAPARADRRRQGRDDRRSRDRRGVDGRRRGLRPLARHARPGPRARRPRAPGRVRGELARGHRRGARRRGLPARPRAGRRRRAHAARPLERQGRRHQRRGPLLPRDRLGAALDRAHRRLLRPAAGVHAGALRRRRARRRRPGPGPRPAHRQGVRADRRAGRPTSACWTPGCGCSSTSRRCCTRRRSAVDGMWSSVGTVNFDNRSFQLHDEVTLGVWDERFAGELHEAFERDLERSDEIEPERWRRRAVSPARSARPRPPCFAASSDPPILRAVRERRPRRAGPGPARGRDRCSPAGGAIPVLAVLADADQAVLRLLRTRGHQEPVEVAMRALGMTGEYGAVWAAVGVVGASIDERRGGQWLLAGAVGPLAVGRQLRRQARDRPPAPADRGAPAARAGARRSSRFPSAHATSSVAAATALGRVEPRARPYLFALAAAICIGRPYLGMHYPSDVLGGAALGFCLGRSIPGLGRSADRGAALRPRRRRERARAGEPTRRRQRRRGVAGGGSAPATPTADPA